MTYKNWPDDPASGYLHPQAADIFLQVSMSENLPSKEDDVSGWFIDSFAPSRL
jgi:hypothetical protein